MTKQEDKRYCTICGRRIGAHIQNTQTFQDGTASYEITYYSAAFTEPACLGHNNTPPPLDCSTALSIRGKVPQAFQDAFNDEELQP